MDNNGFIQRSNAIMDRIGWKVINGMVYNMSTPNAEPVINKLYSYPVNLYDHMELAHKVLLWINHTEELDYDDFILFDNWLNDAMILWEDKPHYLWLDKFYTTFVL